MHMEDYKLFRRDILHAVEKIIHSINNLEDRLMSKVEDFAKGQNEKLDEVLSKTQELADKLSASDAENTAPATPTDSDENV